MKKIIVTFLACFSALISFSQSIPEKQHLIKQKHKKASNSISIKSLDSIDMHQYLGKEVLVFLNNSKISKYQGYVFIHEPLGVLNCLSLKYSDSLYIDIFVNNYTHTKQFDTTIKWKLSTFEKEKLSRIRIMLNNKAVKIIN